ncbi:MAG: hypothetical protein C4320_00550, partial [Armatimonadota bacterium]
MRRPVERWTVSYEEGEGHEVRVPHSWGQDVSLLWEGPAVYRTEIEVPVTPSKLRFYGVSYQALVRITGQEVAHHEGLWDAFDVELTRWRGRAIEVEVSVTKNGGATFPVHSVLSGSIPHLFGTFGGLFRPVELVGAEIPLFAAQALTRVTLQGSRPYVDGRPFFVRGITDRGWNPRASIPTFSAEEQERMLNALKSRGFNFVQFSGHMPDHDYLRRLREGGMMVGLELPISSLDPDKLGDPQIEEELERIVRQYRAWDHVLTWSIGEGPAPWRERMAAKVAALTGSPLVGDSASRDDPRIFGSFALQTRSEETVRRGSESDFSNRDANCLLVSIAQESFLHRDLIALNEKLPFWASGLEELNAPGVRPHSEIVRLARDVPLRDEAEALMEASQQRVAFLRREAARGARLSEPVSGYLLGEVRDTPMSTAGLIDDNGRVRFSEPEMGAWNGPDALFLSGEQPYCVGTGPALWRVRLHTASGLQGRLLWRVLQGSRMIQEGVGKEFRLEPGERGGVGEIYWPHGEAGPYTIEAETANVFSSWTVVRSSPEFAAEVRRGYAELTAHDHPRLVILSDGPGVVERPFWDRCVPLLRGTTLHPDVHLPEVQVGISTANCLDLNYWSEKFEDVEDMMTRV